MTSNAQEGGSVLLERLPALAQIPLIGILRGYEPAAAVEAAAVAHAGGVLVLEVTMDSPDCLAVIEEIAGKERDLAVGVGTVTLPEQVTQAADSGASFVVTPALSEAVISTSLELGLPAIPGVATTTEILRALDIGAVGVKIFPAEQLGGPPYIRAIGGPLGHPAMVPTGGITPQNASDYLASGAVALGAGSALFPSHVGEEADWRKLEVIVGQWIEAIR